MLSCRRVSGAEVNIEQLQHSQSADSAKGERQVNGGESPPDEQRVEMLLATWDAMNHYVAVADTKAAGVIAGCLAMAASVFSVHADGAAPIIAAVGVVLLGLAIVFGAAVLWPRLPSCGKSRVFWVDIRGRTQEEYVREIKNLARHEIDEELAKQCWQLAGVLLKKFKLLQATVVILGVATAAILLAGAVRWGQ